MQSVMFTSTLVNHILFSVSPPLQLSGDHPIPPIGEQLEQNPPPLFLRPPPQLEVPPHMPPLVVEHLAASEVPREEPPLPAVSLPGGVVDALRSALTTLQMSGQLPFSTPAPASVAPGKAKRVRRRQRKPKAARLMQARKEGEQQQDRDLRAEEVPRATVQSNVGNSFAISGNNVMQNIDPGGQCKAFSVIVFM